MFFTNSAQVTSLLGPGHGYGPWKGNSTEPEGSVPNFSWEAQTGGSRKTSKARMWRKNMLRKVLTSFHLVLRRRWRCKRQEVVGGDFLWKWRRGPTPLTPPSQELRCSLRFWPAFAPGESGSGSKRAEHQVWLIYSDFTAHWTGISVKKKGLIEECN